MSSKIFYCLIQKIKIRKITKFILVFIFEYQWINNGNIISSYAV